MKPKVMVVGRHGGDIPGVQVVGRRDVTFPAVGWQVYEAIGELACEAAAQGAVILFQSVPAQVAAVLAGSSTPCGIVVSKPGPRPAGVVTECTFSDSESASQARLAVLAANPRAKVEFSGPESIRVTVDPPMAFEFSHIEWVNHDPHVYETVCPDCGHVGCGAGLPNVDIDGSSEHGWERAPECPACGRKAQNVYDDDDGREHFPSAVSCDRCNAFAVYPYDEEPYAWICPRCAGAPNPYPLKMRCRDCGKPVVYESDAPIECLCDDCAR